MNSKKSLLVILVAMVVLVGGAYLLYEKLGAQMEHPGLVVQEGAGSLTGTENSQAGSVSAGNETGGNGALDGAGAAGGNSESTNGSGSSTNAGNTGNASGSNTTPDDTSAPALTLAPDFTVYDTEDNAFKLSDFRGKPVILNFWASWCGPCKSEMPDFQELYEDYGEEIHFLMVNMTDGYQETVESASKFIADAGYTFPVYYDTASEAAYTYSVYSIPTTYFIDAEGYGVAYGSGALNKDIIMSGIELIQSDK